MDNFSRDTFKLTNTMYQQITGQAVKDPRHYVGVRLQQGVPLVDADWNELEDIRKYEQRAFIKWLVGNGVPQGNDGFCIKDPTVNDFTINNGVCYVDGWEVINMVNTRYTEQVLYNNDELAKKWGVDRLPALQMNTGQYTVYLDVWEREVGHKEDGRMVNDAIGIETCVRLKREWVVRAAAGVQAPAPGPGHVHYKLALIELNNPVKIDPVTDLRRTGLAVLPKEFSIKDDKVGIGIASPQALLHVDGSMAVGPFAVADAQGKLSVTGANAGFNMVKRSLTVWPATPTAGDRFVWYNENGAARLWTDQKGDLLTVTGSGNVIVGTPGPEDKYLFEVAGRMKVRGDRATGSAGIWFSQQYGFGERAFVGLSDDNHIGFTGNTGAHWGLVMDTGNGNVGIGGTMYPTAKLSVGSFALAGTAHSSTFKTNAGALGTKMDDELALASIGFLSKNASAFGIRAVRTKTGDDWTTTAIGFGMDVDDTIRASTTAGFSARALWLNANGYVGIGNNYPRTTLDVNGRIICKNTRKKIEKNDVRPYANNGNWEVVPDMSTTVTVAQNSILIIFKARVKFKGEVLFVLYVGNRQTANTRIKSDTEDRTDVILTALEMNMFPGDHDIRVDWLPTTGSTATISDQQMTRQLLIIEL